MTKKVDKDNAEEGGTNNDGSIDFGTKDDDVVT